jgi:lysyl-tRNA synthetase class 1
MEVAMDWSKEIAYELIQRNPLLDVFVLAAGLSPKAPFNNDNFRELVVIDCVRRELEALGRRARLIFSWDDFDDWKGLPLTTIADEHGCCESMAKHYELTLEGPLKSFDINVEFLYQTKQYQSGRYKEGIHRALVKRDEIFDILSSYRELSVARMDFYPVEVYCGRCKKSHTHVSAYDEGARILYYNCLACNHEGEVAIRQSTQLKLVWTVDWAMRWMEEQVNFEPGTSVHSGVQGSYAIAKEIAEAIFDYQAPVYRHYEGVQLIGHKLETLTFSELAALYNPQALVNLYESYDLSEKVIIPLDEGFVGAHQSIESQIPFSVIVNVLPLVEYDVQLLRELVSSSLEGVDESQLVMTCERIERWIKGWYPVRGARINRAVNRAYYVTLPEPVKAQLKALIGSLSPQSDGLAWERAITRIMTKSQSSQFFEALYHLLISRDRGPQLPLLVELMGAPKAYMLLARTLN